MRTRANTVFGKRQRFAILLVTIRVPFSSSLMALLITSAKAPRWARRGLIRNPGDWSASTRGLGWRA